MDPFITSAVIGGLGNVLGGIFGNSAQRSANRTNMQINREQMEFQERMSNTAYSRAVQDLQRAGLNPMLAVQQGGASSPAGSSTRVEPVDAMARSLNSAGSVIAQAAGIENIMANTRKTQADAFGTEKDNIAKAANSAYAELRAKLEMSQLEADVEQKLASRDLTRAQRQQLQEMLPIIKAHTIQDTKLKEYQTSSAKSEARLKELDIPRGKAEATFYKMFEELGTGNMARMFQMMLQLTKGR